MLQLRAKKFERIVVYMKIYMNYYTPSVFQISHTQMSVAARDFMVLFLLLMEGKVVLMKKNSIYTTR